MTSAHCKTGLDLLVDESFSSLAGQRVALLGHPASVDGNVVHLLDLCLAHGVQLAKLFGPEHGMLGDLQDMDHVAGHRDHRTGLEVISLYGTSRESLMLSPAQLDGVDVLVCDLQDVGSRYYTYQYTVAFALRACAQAGVKAMVLDRPNPIGGQRVEGNLVEHAYRSFVGEYALPMRTGLTLGELCSFFADCDGVDHDVFEVKWMEGWRRRQHFQQTGLPWVIPSPNLPTPDTALVYPGGCLYEGTNLSEGRGTTRPFELVGAPYVTDTHAFAERVAQHAGAGVKVRPTAFRPTFQKHAGQLCRGLQLHVTDPERFSPVRAAVAVVWAAKQEEGFAWRQEPYEFVADRLAIDLLFGSDRPRKMLDQGGSVNDIMAALDVDGPKTAALHQKYQYAGYNR